MLKGSMFLFIGMLVAISLAGCGENPCKLVEEFLDKADSIIDNSPRDDRQNRISDLIKEYDKKLTKVDGDVVQLAKKYIDFKNNFTAINEMSGSDPAMNAYFNKQYGNKKAAAMNTISRTRRDVIEKCHKAK
jgi:hypothetical protein